MQTPKIVTLLDAVLAHQNGWDVEVNDGIPMLIPSGVNIVIQIVQTIGNLAGDISHRSAGLAMADAIQIRELSKGLCKALYDQRVPC